MHEVGHNLGLHHAGWGLDFYGDQSGYMGSTYADRATPVMCFNAAKSSQLGWYSDKEVTIEPSVSTWSGKLIGLADYGSPLGQDYHVILSIHVPGTSYKVYSTYNRKAGINDGTMRFADKVTLVDQEGTLQSFAVTSLALGEHFLMENFHETGIDLFFMVNEAGEDQGVKYLNLLVHFNTKSKPPLV